MTSGRRIEELLERAPTRPLKRRLYRVVPALSYLRSARPTGEDLTRPWRLAEQPTRLQELGAAVCRQHRVQALRLPSVHGADGGAPRFNVAIFPSSLVAPSRLRVLGESGAILEDLP